MKPLLLIIALIGCIKIYSQEMPAFRSLRFDEDYSFLRNDSARNGYQQLKFSPLSKNKKTYISFGGDFRFQYFYTKNEGWGDAPEDDDGYTLTRILAHADLHAGNNFRAFVQLQSSLAGSRIDPSPVDENPLDLHQAFVDIITKPTAGSSLVLRLGRQEFSYGSQRLISVREGPNNRQSFDAIRALLNSGNYKFDFFYSHYVIARSKIFDDGFNRNTKFWGAYIVGTRLPAIKNADFYYLGLWKKNATFDDGAGEELRHSVGSRIWSNSGDFKYDIEGLYQFGKFSDKTISAWTASVNASYTFSRNRFKPEIGLKTELISGDKQYDDDYLQTFNPLFPRGAYFGLAALIGPANLIDVHPSLSLAMTDKLNLGLDYDIFWRYSRNDGLYGVNGSLTYSGKNISSKYIGDQLSVNFTYSVSRFLNFTTEFTWFNAGSFLEAAGSGKDILFTGVTAQFIF